MELKIGLKFQKYYGEGNINNISYCEVRGIIDDCFVVLYCKKRATKFSKKKEYYLGIYKIDFDYNVEKNIYIPL